MRFLLGAIVGAACLLGDLSSAQAQFRWGIGFGSGYGGFYPGYGGYYGGYPYGGWGGGYRGYYGGYNDYYSRPRTYTRTVVVPPKQVGDGQPIKIFTLDNSGVPLTYQLNGMEQTLKPGESQMLVFDRNWTVRFDRGGDFGTAEYSLSSGQYWFELTDHGWELFHDPDVSKITGGQDAKKNALPPVPPPPK